MIWSCDLCRWKTCNGTVLAFAKDYVEPLLEDLLPVGISKEFPSINVDLYTGC